MRYLNELEKDRSPLVNRVFKFETKNIACESRRMVIQLGRRCSTVSILRKPNDIFESGTAMLVTTLFWLLYD